MKKGMLASAFVAIAIVSILAVASFAYAGAPESAPGNGQAYGNGGAQGGPKPACSDKRDNDHDGLCDFNGVRNKQGVLTCAADPGCTSLNDTDEYNCVASAEVCDGVDNDCDLEVDEGGVCPTLQYYCDLDADAYKGMNISGSCSSYNCVPSNCQIPSGNDCNDNNAAVNPGMIELCDGIDNNCNALIDEGGVCDVNATCRELFPGTNVANASRVNVVFVAINYSNITSFVYDSQRAVDYYGALSGKGLLELPVYTGSKEKFNFWYVNRLFSATGDPAISCTYASNPESSQYCTGLPNRYVANLAAINFRGCAYLGGTSYNSIYYGNNFPYMFDHEFQHQFPRLRDEYTEGSSNWWGSPNCAPNLSTAQLWWGDLEGVVVEGLTTGYYSGCSYVTTNIRPTTNSIMRTNGNYLFGAVNQRHVSTVLGGFTGSPMESPMNAIKVTLEGEPGDIGSFRAVSMEPASTYEVLSTEAGKPHRLVITAGGNSYTQQFDINDYLVEDDLSGEALSGGITVIPKSSVEVLVPLPPGAAYDRTLNLIIANGKAELPEIAIEKMAGAG